MAGFLIAAGLLAIAGRADAVCSPEPGQGGLSAREGYVQFLPEEELAKVKSVLPRVADERLAAVLSDPNTIWYDERTMVFSYQDSVESVVGNRANCVGRMVGECNRNNVIVKLMLLFGPYYKFKFPFRTAAGTDDSPNVRVYNFWSPPRRNGRVMPVKWWKASRRGRWHWVFPKDTLIGEVLMMERPNGDFYIFEIRTRRRYLDGWSVDLFRPFPTAESLAEAIEEKRPNWREKPALARLVNHLRNPDTLVRDRLDAGIFKPVFATVEGALDILPPAEDDELIATLLRTTTFQSMEGAIWKEGNGLETYAPSTNAEFHVVPANYKMGMIPVNEVSCNRCHQDTGHPLKTFEFDVILYGEVWGEDRIFTWHLFKPHRQIFDTWDDADGSRTINPMLQQAGLLLNERPAASDPDYRQLPTPY